MDQTCHRVVLFMHFIFDKFESMLTKEPEMLQRDAFYMQCSKMQLRPGLTQTP